MLMHNAVDIFLPEIIHRNHIFRMVVGNGLQGGTSPLTAVSLPYGLPERRMPVITFYGYNHKNFLICNIIQGITIKTCRQSPLFQYKNAV